MICIALEILYETSGTAEINRWNAIVLRINDDNGSDDAPVTKMSIANRALIGSNRFTLEWMALDLPYTLAPTAKSIRFLIQRKWASNDTSTPRMKGGS